GGHDAHRDTVGAGLPGVHEIEGAYRDRDQVAGKRTSGRKDHLLHATRLIGFGDLRSVGDGGVLLTYVKCNLPGRFKIGLIETGKGAARVNAFELSEQVRFFAV